MEATTDTMRETEAADAATCVTFEQVVVFHVDEQRFALPIDNVQEIQQIVQFSEVPGSSGIVRGMVNLRGEVIPAVDARELLGAEPRSYGLETPMVIATANGRLIALVVDEVEDVLGLPLGCMQEPPAMQALSNKLVGVARLDDGLIYVFDAGLLLEAAGAAA